VHRIPKVIFESVDTTPFDEHLNGSTVSYTFRIGSSPPSIEWALPVGPCCDLIHNPKGDLRSNSSWNPPWIILIGRCRDSKQVFGARVNIHTLVCQVLPLLLHGTDTHPLVVIHLCICMDIMRVRITPSPRNRACTPCLHRGVGSASPHPTLSDGLFGPTSSIVHS
jgi:hypothetical protein